MKDLERYLKSNCTEVTSRMFPRVALGLLNLSTAALKQLLLAEDYSIAPAAVLPVVSSIQHRYHNTPYGLRPAGTPVISSKPQMIMTS